MASTYTVDHSTDLLTFLFAKWPDVKRTKIRQWLKHGAVLVNGQPVARIKHPLQAGDMVSVCRKGEIRRTLRLSSGISVVFEDDALIVIEKPTNMLSVASETQREKTAYALLTDFLQRRDRRRGRQLWIVHRLDRATSGLMMFAKTEEIKDVLKARWTHVDKRYLAVVEGQLPAEQGVLSSHLDESNPFRVFVSEPSERTRHAVTHYRVIKRTDTRSLVELRLETGRRNQIRVQLAHLDCAIVGDRKYGSRTQARRLALHASSLKFQHPVSREWLAFESPLPAELERLVE